MPWYHHLTLLEQLKSRGDRIAYAALAVENGWSRNVMVHQIDLKVADQHGKAVTNFKKLMPPPDSDMADLDKPIGVSTYQLGLPSSEQLQAKLQKVLASYKKIRR